MIQGSRWGSWPVAGALLAGLALVAGCGPKPAVAPPDADPDACTIGPAADPSGRVIRIGVTEPVDLAHAPVPTNDAERLIFRQCYETLVRVDCTGQVRPGLAESWEPSTNGRGWIFTLRPNARFWDGEDADADAVAVALWSTWGRATSLAPELRWIDPESLTALDARRLQISFSPDQGEDASVRLFAHPATAVAIRRGPGVWPQGTGPLRMEPIPTGNEVVLVPAGGPSLPHPSGGEREIDAGTETLLAALAPILRVTVSPGADPRDLLAEGTDLVVARSRSFTDYAGRLPDVDLMPLPWDRIYVLLAPRDPDRDERVPAGEGDEQSRTRLREDLASRGCASDARPAHGMSFDVGLSGSCPRVAAAKTWPEYLSGPPARAQLVYPAGDADAGLLAERLMGLAIMKSDLLGRALPLSFLARTEATLRTQALGSFAWRDALGWEDELGYVLPVRRESFDLCGLLSGIRLRAPWVELGPEGPGPEMVPLVVTRPVVAMRRGLGGLRVDGDGTLLLQGAGWIDEEATP
jgi:hypothetical protein